MTMMNHRIWILGASDPEMTLIEELLRACGEEYIYALDDRGERVHPVNSYRCPTPVVPEGSTVYAVECIDVLPEGWVRIDHHRPGDPGYGLPPEEFLTASSIGQVLSVLAHTPVDMRRDRRDRIVLGKHPEISRDLLTGSISSDDLHTDWHLEGFGTFRDSHLQSSPDVGDRTAKQILNNTKRFCFAGGHWYACPYLGSEDRGRHEQYFTVLRVPTHILLVAAADHCLAAAYRGECPGVDPDDLMRWRAETRAAHQGRSVDDVLADIALARREVQEAQIVDCDFNAKGWCDSCGPNCMFCSSCGTCECGANLECPPDYLMCMSVLDLRGYEVPELPEAAAREGWAYLATVTDRDGREKVVLGGATSPEMVREFMMCWAPAEGLVDIYGDPERGFAGGYIDGGAK